MIARSPGGRPRSRAARPPPATPSGGTITATSVTTWLIRLVARRARSPTGPPSRREWQGARGGDRTIGQPIFAVRTNNGCAGSDRRRRNRRSRRRLRALAGARGRALRARAARGRARQHPRRTTASRSTPGSSSTTRRTTRCSAGSSPSSACARTTRRCRSRSAAATAGSSTRAGGRSPSRGTPRARASTRCSGRSGAGCAPRGRSLDEADYESASLGDYLDARGYSQRFRSHFLVPLTAALWSTAPGRALEFPAAYAIRFFDNHGMLGFGRFRWRTVTGGSRVLRRRDRRPARRRRCGSDAGVRVDPARRPTASSCATRDGERRRFDKVVVATHADEALALLEDPSAEERRALGGFAYTVNDTVLHTDSSLLPRARAARASWNYRDGRRRPADADLLPEPPPAARGRRATTA